MYTHLWAFKWMVEQHNSAIQDFLIIHFEEMISPTLINAIKKLVSNWLINAKHVTKQAM